MSFSGNIRYVANEAIDREKWDACVASAPNGLIYGHSVYLDALAGRWDALVLDDYLAVMPLPWRKKWGISYIYQPFLNAQLGVFGAHIDKDMMRQFLEAIPKRFKLIEYPLNHGNLPTPEGFGIYLRNNYILNLSRTYEALQQGYREQTRRNIRKAEKYGCVLKKDIDVAEVIDLAGAFTEPIGTEDSRNFIKLYNELHARGQAIIYGMTSGKGELLASAAFFFSNKRAYYLLVGNHPNGRTLGASHALIDAFIRDHAGRDLILDFEGSDLRNLAFFYSSFGAQEERYPALRLNRLPRWIRLFKK